jgi:DNA-binding transcriptional ArsR family regulator
MSDWSFLSNHGRALLCIAHDPEVRLRDIGQNLGITERRAYDLVTDLTEAGYLIKERQGRRNRYQVQEHLPRPEAPEHDQAIGDVLALLTQQQNVHPFREKAERRGDH